MTWELTGRFIPEKALYEITVGEGRLVRLSPGEFERLREIVELLLAQRQQRAGIMAD